MAMNPMQRKVRNSFLLGVIVALIIGAVAVVILILQIRKLNDEITAAQTKAKTLTTNVYALTKNVKEGENLAGDAEGNGIAIETVAVPTQIVPENALTVEQLEKYKENDAYQMVSKLDMKSGTILTTDLVEKSKDSTSYRTVEYSMISLPSKLVDGDYIDIRIKYFSGEDLVILSKVYVDSCTTNSIYLTLSESELLLLNNAIIESYIIEGASLYATLYKDEAQPKLTQTYSANENVAALMNKNGNGSRNKDIMQQMNEAKSITRDFVNSLMKKYDTSEQIDKVQEGFSQERSNIQAARESLLGSMGY